MIDLQLEKLIALREAPHHLPRRPNGKRVHISACYRWISRGVRGVRLESVQVGGTRYTSLEALQRFADGLGSPGDSRSASDRPLPRTRQAQIGQASKRLREALGLNGSARVSSSDRPQEARDK